MKILVTNGKKLTEAIMKAEGRATARTITATDICHVLDKIKVPKSKLDGTVVYYDGGEHFANAYKYRPESTHFRAENIKGKWYITDIRRDTCPNRERSGRISYGEQAKAWIVEDASYL